MLIHIYYCSLAHTKKKINRYIHEVRILLRGYCEGIGRGWRRTRSRNVNICYKQQKYLTNI